MVKSSCMEEHELLSQDKISEMIHPTQEIKTVKSEKKHVMVHDYTFAHMGIMMIIAAFLGFVGENIFRLIVDGQIDNRFMILPFIAPYGLAIFAIYYVLGTPNKLRFFNKEVLRGNTVKDKVLSYLIYGITVMLAVMLGEIAVGSIYEAISGLTIWNYENIPLHITKFTSIPTSLAITVLAIILMRFLFVPCMDFISNKIPYKVAFWITLILGGLIVIDCIYMMIELLVFQDKNYYWVIKFFMKG